MAVAGAITPALAADDDQAPAEPAATRYNPTPTVAEELVYLRDIIALQTLRLDEAEETLKRQNELIAQQAAKIDALELSLNETRTAMRAGGVQTASASLSGAYVVKSGDTLGKIARANGTTVAALASANNIKAPYPLTVGQRLVMPGGGAALAQAGPASPPDDAKIQQSTENASGAEPQKVAASGITPEERPDVTQRAVRQEREKEKEPEGGAIEEVGVRPEEERPYLSIFTDVGGILTPRGTLYAEPSIDFTVSSDNRFFFQGVEIVDAVLIGAIEASDSDRRAITESLGLRYGLTSRLEIDGRISYASREDRITGVLIDDQTSTFRQLSGSGFGDAEMGLHYQINNGKGFPYTVLNLRAKAPTGTGPFEVERELNGIEKELATGSGYWSVEPSLTFILPSDPAVIFANVGYQYNMSTSPHAVITRSSEGDPTQILHEFDPGDAIRTSIGVGLSLNDRTSVNFGYDQSHILETTSTREFIANNQSTFATSNQTSTTIGAFLFGGSYAVSDRLRINFNTAVGATDEAPDIRVSLRAQMRLFD